MKHTLRMILVLAMIGLTSTVALAQPSVEPADPQEGCEYYEQTEHNLCAPFLSYWNDNGGLEVFGYPISEAAEEENPDLGGDLRLAQYFERERLEHHPENAGTAYEVLLGRLGAQLLALQDMNWHEFPKDDPGEANYFPETGFAVPDKFYDYWSSHGLDFGDAGNSYRESLALFGYPISPAQVETNAAGDTVLTQWFERARFELHDDDDVLLGLLGVEIVDLLYQDEEPPVAELEVFAEGLDQPRGIIVGGDGAIYVALAGSGGDECFAGPMEQYGGAEFCAGSSGEVARIQDGETQTVVAELPSIETPGFVIGPHDIATIGDGEMYVAVGALGSHEELGRFGQILHIDGEGERSVVADLYEYEHETDPERELIESDPYSLAMTADGDLTVTDAAANVLFIVSQDGEITPLFEFEERIAALPPELQEPDGPEEIPMDAVPTGVAIGPDGAYYVGELTGFPYPVGEARVWRVTPEGEGEIYAEGFTNIIDIAFDSQGRLHVLEMASGSLTYADPEDPATLVATLIRVEEDGTHTTIASDGLQLATGLAIGPDDAIYVSNLGTVPGGGQLVRIADGT